MIGSGVFEKEVNGEKVGFKFGMYASAVTAKECGCSIYSVFQKIGGKEGDGSDMQFCLLNYFYGAAVSYAISKKIEKPSVDQVADWIDGMGLDACMDLYLESLKTPESKNAQPPEEKPGEKTTT